jgi:hypothetical protein
MRLNWVALGAALSAVLFGALNIDQINAQAFVGPNGTGGWNAYLREGTAKDFNTAVTDAEATTFPGYSVSGVEIIPASTKAGHLLTLQSRAEADFVVNNVGTGWLGLTDSDDWADQGAVEGGNLSGAAYPAFKANSSELREVPVEGQRGYGWVWVTGEPLEFQNWNANEPNDAGGNEDYAELIGGGLANDLPLTSTLGSLIEFDLNLSEAPIQYNLDLANEGGKLAGKVVASTSAEFGSKALSGPTWEVAEQISVTLRAPGAAAQTGGLYATYLNGNYNTVPSFDSAVANINNQVTAPFFVDRISWGNDTPNAYPAALGWTGNHENYSAEFKGEIFVPEGTVTFRDHNDDYAYLKVGEQTLIDDNNWTSYDGSQNGGGAAASFVASKNDATVEGLQGGWYPFTFRGGEGGGGDNFRLLWDATDKGTTEPTSANVDTAGDFFTVGTPFLRATDPGVVSLVLLPLGVAGVTSSGLAGTDTLGTAGANAEVPTNGAEITYVGEHTYVLTATLGGITQSITKTIDFGGGPVDGIPGDIDGNGKVDLTDFGILKENFGKSAAAGAAVPEPSTLALLGLGSLCGLVGLSRRGRKQGI